MRESINWKNNPELYVKLCYYRKKGFKLKKIVEIFNSEFNFKFTENKLRAQLKFLKFPNEVGGWKYVQSRYYISDNVPRMLGAALTVKLIDIKEFEKLFSAHKKFYCEQTGQENI